jgi:hypothetical protein
LRANRTPQQKDADRFDMQLYQLIGAAERAYDLYPAASKTWGKVLRDLRAARPSIRGLMAKVDRDLTS